MARWSCANPRRRAQPYEFTPSAPVAVTLPTCCRAPRPCEVEGHCARARGRPPRRRRGHSSLAKAASSSTFCRFGDLVIAPEARSGWGGTAGIGDRAPGKAACSGQRARPATHEKCGVLAIRAAAVGLAHTLRHFGSDEEPPWARLSADPVAQIGKGAIPNAAANSRAAPHRLLRARDCPAE